MKAFSFRVVPNSQRTTESQPDRPQLLVLRPTPNQGNRVPDRPTLHVQLIKFPLHPSVKVTSRADQFRRPLNLSVVKGKIVFWPKSEIPVFPATSTCTLRPPLKRLTSSVVCFLF